MPVYSYKCKDCGEEFDLLVGVGQGSEELKCRKCGSKNLDRMLTSFGVGAESSSIGSSSCPTGTCSLPPQ